MLNLSLFKEGQLPGQREPGAGGTGASSESDLMCFSGDLETMLHYAL